MWLLRLHHCTRTYCYYNKVTEAVQFLKKCHLVDSLWVPEHTAVSLLLRSQHGRWLHEKGVCERRIMGRDGKQEIQDVSLALFITTTHTETQWRPPELCQALSGLSPMSVLCLSSELPITLKTLPLKGPTTF